MELTKKNYIQNANNNMLDNNEYRWQFKKKINKERKNRQYGLCWTNQTILYYNKSNENQRHQYEELNARLLQFSSNPCSIPLIILVVISTLCFFFILPLHLRSSASFTLQFTTLDGNIKFHLCVRFEWKKRVILLFWSDQRRRLVSKNTLIFDLFSALSFSGCVFSSSFNMEIIISTMEMLAAAFKRSLVWTFVDLNTIDHGWMRRIVGA